MQASALGTVYDQANYSSLKKAFLFCFWTVKMLFMVYWLISIIVLYMYCQMIYTIINVLLQLFYPCFQLFIIEKNVQDVL